jgi:uncharacterized protein YcfJ
VPVTKREVIPQQITQQVPVTNQRIVQDEHVSTYHLGTAQGAIASSSNGSTIANRDDTMGGVDKLDDQQPRNDSSDQISRRR